MSSLLLTTLSASWGRQSTWLIWEMILGRREVPENFVCLTADPGMEKAETYLYQLSMRELCAEHGIEIRVAAGRDLFDDLTVGVPATKARARAAFGRSDAEWEEFLDMVSSGLPAKEQNQLFAEQIGFIPRFDQPAFYVAKPNGKRGKLAQRCTGAYKISPMRRELREILNERYGCSYYGRIPGRVETWLGFATDEAHRIKPSDVQYIDLRYPLIESGLSRTEIDRLYVKYDVPAPPSSVCNGCFAHGLRAFKEMAEKNPADFEQACQVDEAIRDLRIFGIRYPAYASDTLVPLRQLAAQDFSTGEFWKDVEHECSSGVCFV